MGFPPLQYLVAFSALPLVTIAEASESLPSAHVELVFVPALEGPPSLAEGPRVEACVEPILRTSGSRLLQSLADSRNCIVVVASWAHLILHVAVHRLGAMPPSTSIVHSRSSSPRLQMPLAWVLRSQWTDPPLRCACAAVVAQTLAGSPARPAL